TELRELGLTLEGADGGAPVHVAPGRLPRVEHEPAVPLRNESVLGGLELRLGNHDGSLPHRTTARNVNRQSGDGSGRCSATPARPIGETKTKANSIAAASPSTPPITERRATRCASTM